MILAISPPSQPISSLFEPVMSHHPSHLPVEELLADCEVKRTRGSGPGGQHRNKVETAVVIRHKPTDILGQASERRSQHANRTVAIFRLRINLAIGFRTEPKLIDVPSSLWTNRRTNNSTQSGGKIVIGSEHDDFPALLAEALDFVFAEDHDVAAAAKRLSISNSQLLKLIRMEPMAWQRLNEERTKLGLHKLK